MKTTWTIPQQIAASLLFPLIVLIGLAVVSVHNAARLLEISQELKQTYRVLTELDELHAHFLDAETGQRGFIITGDDAFLEPYEAALHAIDVDYEELRRLTADSPVEQERLDRLRPIMRDKLEEMRLTIEQRRREGAEATARTVASGRGRRAMDELRAVAGELRAEELRVLDARERQAADSERRLLATLTAGSTFTILVVAGVGFLIIRGINRRVRSATRRIESSATELQAAATQQAQGSKEQATTSNEVSATMRELLSTSHQIAESTQRVTQIAADTAAAARAGDDTVKRAREGIDSVQRQVEQIVLHMLDFGKKSQEIGGILQIINELAEQTNILAINATIEAAGAGDAGRRFGVVADEIRKLADRVGGSTKEIRALIEEIRSAANTTVIATESGSKAVDASARQFGDVATSFRQISELVSSTAEASREIELSTKQQATAVEQVNAALLDVARTARETEASSSVTLKTSSELATLSKDLVRLVQHRPSET
ncbi:CHASE3 domain-containing protein [Sorangium sp. So ce1099]|uniref:CHASE3 domain-containing protein n=1 Tax=Sorangium sp. So ce1099 TaxID=3133331 RepID=UPI003F5EF1A1